MTAQHRSGRAGSLLVLAVTLFVCLGLAVSFAGTTQGQEKPHAAVFDASPDLVQLDEEVRITYTAAGATVDPEDVTITLTHISGQNVTFEGRTGTKIEQKLPINADSLPPGPYNVTVAIEGGPSDTLEDAFEIAATYQPGDATFSPSASSDPTRPSAYKGTAGDFVELSVSLDAVDEAYILIGGGTPESDEFDAPLDILHVTGSPTILINTRLVGTDRPSEDVYIPVGGGTVTSYAHDLGPASKPTGPFEGLRFETKDYEQVAETLAEFRTELGMGAQIRPIQPAQYSLTIGGGNSIIVREDGLPDPRHPLDRARLELTKPSLENVTTYAVPTGNANEVGFEPDAADIQELTPQDAASLVERVTERDSTASGDRILVEFEATGMYGALVDSIPGLAVPTEQPPLLTFEEFSELLGRPEGISLSVSHTNPAPNTDAVDIDLTDAPLDDVAVIPSPTLAVAPTETQRFFMLIDTRQPAPFDTALEGGENFNFEFRYESPPGSRYQFDSPSVETQPPPFDPRGGLGHYPYFTTQDTTVSRSASMTVEEPAVTYDRTTLDGKPVVSNRSGVTISGSTNLAPGSDLPVKLIVDVRHEPITVESERLTIDENGNFSSTFDLAMLNASSDEVTVEFRAYQKRIDKRPVKVVDPKEAGASFTVTNLATESFVRANGTIVDLSTTVTNTGLLPDEKTVELLIDGTVVANRTVSLNATESRTFHFANQTAKLDAGEYAIEIRTPDDREGQLLVVEERDGIFEIESLSARPVVRDNGTEIAFSTTIVNAGTINETGTIELLVDGEQVTQRSPDLLAGQARTYTFADELATLETGQHELVVQTPDASRSITVTLAPPNATFELTTVDVPQTVQQADLLNATVTVTNTGNIAANATLTANFANQSIGSRVVSLGPGNQTTIDFSTQVEQTPGEYDIIFQTPDDERTFLVTVEANQTATATENESDEPAATETAGNDSSAEGTDNTSAPPEDPATDDATGSFLGIGVASRAVLGGTAIVGAVHVLGYWV